MRTAMDNSISSRAGREPLRIPVKMPATQDNIEKVRAILKAINQTYAARGINRRVRLFVGDTEERVA